MKIPPYFMNTPSYLIIHQFQPPMDVNKIMYRIGKALGVVK